MLGGMRLPMARLGRFMSQPPRNRRVVKSEDGDTAKRREEIEGFHEVLNDVSMGIASQRVRKFLAESYVRGTLNCATADHAELEGNTSVHRAARHNAQTLPCTGRVVPSELSHV